MPTPTTPPISPQAGGDALLDTKGAAAFLALSPFTLTDWRVKGQGPRFLKLGRAARYRLSDLQAWLEARAFQNTSEAKGA